MTLAQIPQQGCCIGCHRSGSGWCPRASSVCWSFHCCSLRSRMQAKSTRNEQIAKTKQNKTKQNKQTSNNNTHAAQRVTPAVLLLRVPTFGESEARWLSSCSASACTLAGS